MQSGRAREKAEADARKEAQEHAALIQGLQTHIDELQKTRDRDQQDRLSAQESLKEQLEKYAQEQVDAALAQAQQQTSQLEQLLEPQMQALSQQVEELQERHRSHLEATEAGGSELDKLKAAVAEVEAGASKQWEDAQN